MVGFPCCWRTLLALVVFALGCAPSARAESDIRLSASVVDSSDSASVIFGSGDAPFFVRLSSYTIERSGSTISVVADLQLAPPGVETPDIEIPLGRLSPGRYTVYGTARVLGEVVPRPATVLGLQVVPATVAANDPWLLAALMLAVLGLALRHERRRRGVR